MTLLSQTIELLQPPFLDHVTTDFFLRLVFNLAAIYILLRVIYFPTYRNKDYIFTMALFNVIIFVIAYLLNKVEITLGFAFGLFAVFTMLRYRTQTINSKNMTFLVIAIGMALIHAVSPISIVEMIIVNVIILGITYLLNSNLIIRNEARKTVIYENIDLIKPEKRSELINDLRNRTGLNINRVAIGRVDFMRDIARVRIFYYPDQLKEREEITEI